MSEDPQKKRESAKRYRENNREKDRERKRLWAKQNYLKDPQAAAKKAAKYRSEHPEVTRKCSQHYYQRHKEEMKERRKAWQRLNREHANKRQREYRSSRIEIYRERERTSRQTPEARAKRHDFWNSYYAKNRDKLIFYQRRYRANPANDEVRMAAIRKWLRTHTHRLSVYYNTRRARELGCPGTHTGADVIAIWERQRGRCAVPGCKHPIADNGRNKYQVDHIAPLSKGGSNDPCNLQILCRFHNLQKSARDPYEWAQSNGMLFPK